MSGEIRRENFADEASWLEFQRNQAELAKHKREREAAQKHAAAGRDYAIVKRINRRIKSRENCRRWYWNDHEKTRRLSKERWRRMYYKNPALYREKTRQWYWKNREWVRQRSAWHRASHREEIAAQQRQYRASHREEIAIKQRQYRAANQEKINARGKAYYLANQEKIIARSHEWYIQNRDRAAMSSRARRAQKHGVALEEYLAWLDRPKATVEERRSKNAARMREWRMSLSDDELAVHRAHVNELLRVRRARKRAEKLAQQQQQAS